MPTKPTSIWRRATLAGLFDLCLRVFHKKTGGGIEEQRSPRLDLDLEEVFSGAYNPRVPKLGLAAITLPSCGSPPIVNRALFADKRAVKVILACQQGKARAHKGTSNKLFRVGTLRRNGEGHRDRDYLIRKLPFNEKQLEDGSNPRYQGAFLGSALPAELPWKTLKEAAKENVEYEGHRMVIFEMFTWFRCIQLIAPMVFNYFSYIRASPTLLPAQIPHNEGKGGRVSIFVPTARSGGANGVSGRRNLFPAPDIEPRDTCEPLAIGRGGIPLSFIDNFSVFPPRSPFEARVVWNLQLWRCHPDLSSPIWIFVFLLRLNIQQLHHSTTIVCCSRCFEGMFRRREFPKHSQNSNFPSLELLPKILRTAHPLH
ncbi:unnamed protein product [Nesidiocoris tenuis]|uniref:Uncharacterized protein n=1 Tax=Nesidiocoris tenuis TaxID=355587 RepID=A0A6H5HKC5_9HEMI|nr:unnamed protein product [Nesidiocoris tenuis]